LSQGRRAFVLAAGLGTRLRPLTETWPKPAVPFLGPPLLRRTFASLALGGVRRVAVNTHHLPEVMERVAREEAARLGLSVVVVREPVIQGTGGGIRGLQAALPGEDPVIVWNGDILFAPDVAELLTAHQASGAAATMVLLPMPAGRHYAPVEVDGAGRVRRIAGVGSSRSGLTPWHFSGVHVLSSPVFSAMARSGPEDINRDVYPRLFDAGGVQGRVVDAPWNDLGSVATYLDAQADLLAGRMADPLDPESPLRGRARPEALVEPGARVHPSAQLGTDVFVGSGVEVSARANVQRAALLPGSIVRAGETVTGEIRWSGKRLREKR
jgi:mannose-1-phosphate guanylyltransferase